MGVSITTGFILGLLGSLHCIGMCGPIALIIPTSKNPVKKFTQILTYNFGRVLTYSLFGLIFGLLGESFRFIRIQQYVSIIIGLLLVTIVLVSLFTKMKQESKANRLILTVFSPVKKQLGKFLKKDRKNLLAIGILNGFLPCGLIYFALASSLTTNSIGGSVVFMALFGFGTFPAMIAVMYLRNHLNNSPKFTKIVPYMLLIMGVLLVMRGMNLGIPIVSPKIETTANNTETLGGCCTTDMQFEE